MNMTDGQAGTVPITPGAEQPDFSPSVKMLIGTYERKLDSKLRLGLPHQFRDRLGDHPLIMVRWLKRSLAIFPECNWLPFAEAISRLDLYTEAGLTVRHQMFAHAREVSMDKEGRIVLPQDMIDYARLEKKMMLLGDWDKITVWSHTYYQDQVAIDDVTVTERFPAVLQMAKGQKSLESFEQEVGGESS
ncbi:division/cell wall cluster transcriptional repressor MraZ [bacterium]|nr:division/cell wall cluster transcriptional repressor MraZ [bacterium]